MATRHNTCTNPALTNDLAGWSGGSTPARTAVSGFDRPYAARYTSGTFSNSARGAVVAGQQVTISQYARLDTAAATVNGALFLEWRDVAESVITYDTGSYSIPGGVVARQSITFTPPAGAAFVSLISEGFNFATGNGDFSMVLIEEGPDLLDYFDGDSAGATWDGAPGNSASTLDDIVAATLDGSLPSLVGGATAEVEVRGTATAGLPALTGALAGAAAATARIDASLPALVAVMAGQVAVAGEAAGTLPALSAALTGQVVSPQGSLAAVLPALRASMAGESDFVEQDIAGLVGAPQTRWPIGAPATRFVAGAPYA